MQESNWNYDLRVDGSDETREERSSAAYPLAVKQNKRDGMLASF
jgi:hypothetical protein